MFSGCFQGVFGEFRVFSVCFQGVFRVFFPMPFPDMPFGPFQARCLWLRAQIAVEHTSENREPLSVFLNFALVLEGF